MDITLKTQVTSKDTALEIFDAILKSRGFTSASSRDIFLSPPAPNLEYLLKESGIKKQTLLKAKKILDAHLTRSSDICIFGDYDADGVTSTAIMYQAVVAYAKIQKSTARILPFVPDRHKHGYGLGVQAVNDVISGAAFDLSKNPNFTPQLVITVDTGIVAHAGIQTFTSHNVEVIVTDHHLPDRKLEGPSAIVHTLETSGAGVAWIFAMSLLGDAAIRLIDLAVIGVVADMMPLVGLNRAIVMEGLHALTRTSRVGIVSMKEAMQITNKNLSTYDISFGIAPRINAAGRIYNPLDALRLLCTTNKTQAMELAQKIEAHNKDRQEYTDKALLAVAGEQGKSKIIAVVGDYHEGVIGLVAGKLAEMHHRPSLVMSDKGDIIKGSARSVPGISITDLLRSLKTPFLGLGGHDQAAGFSLEKKNLNKMLKELKNLAEEIIPSELLVKTHFADLKLELAQTSLKLAKLLSTMEPFGMQNQKPKFLFENLEVLEDVRLKPGSKHRKLMLSQDGVTRQLMLFGSDMPYPLKNIKKLICNLDINVWREKETLQLIGSYVEV